MGTVIKLKAIRRQRAEHKTLCRSGFHKWKPVAEGRFDVKQGKLLTAERCTHCGQTRTRLT